MDNEEYFDIEDMDNIHDRLIERQQDENAEYWDSYLDHHLEEHGMVDQLHNRNDGGPSGVRNTDWLLSYTQSKQKMKKIPYFFLDISLGISYITSMREKQSC